MREPRRRRRGALLALAGGTLLALAGIGLLLGVLGVPGLSGLPGLSGSGAPVFRDDRGIAYVELDIPRLGVRAPITGIGMRSRTLTPPNRPSVVGWWRGSAPVGSGRGTTMLVGHTVKVPGVAGLGKGALGRLSQARAGDRIAVVTSAGTLRYRVTRVDPAMSYARFAKDSTRIADRTYAGGRLVLVTCWSDGRRFTGNTVLYAAPL